MYDVERVLAISAGHKRGAYQSERKTAGRTLDDLG